MGHILELEIEFEEAEGGDLLGGLLGYYRSGTLA